MNDEPQAMTLAEALNALDPKSDDHWTKTGLPKLAVLKGMTGNDDLTQADVNAIVPDGYNRANAHAAPTFVDQADEEDEAEALPFDPDDPIELLERATALSQHDAFRRNNPLQNVIRAYMVSGQEIREVQARLDKRQADREERKRSQEAKEERREALRPRGPESNIGE